MDRDAGERGLVQNPEALLALAERRFRLASRLVPLHEGVEPARQVGNLAAAHYRQPVGMLGRAVLKALEPGSDPADRRHDAARP